MTRHPTHGSTHRSTWITPDEAREAMRTGAGRGIKVAIIDSGVELSHPELAHLRLVDDIAFRRTEDNRVVEEPGWGIDVFGHGTAIASVLRRCAPDVQIGSFRVMNEKLGCSFAQIQMAAMTAIERGYSIINCSFGSNACQNFNINHYKPWIDLAYRKGVHVVSACSNVDFRMPEWPGHFPSVITVDMARTAEDELYFRWDTKTANLQLHLVEFAARGVDLTDLPWKGGTVAPPHERTGSSYAAPHAAGLLARLLSVHPGIKPPVAKALLQEIAHSWYPALSS